MNFEIVDNLFQVGVTFICLVISAVTLIRTGRQIYVALTGVYGGFVIGTLFYTLHLIIIGTTPHLSYCAEISWMAAFLFMQQIVFLRALPEEKTMSKPAAAATALVMAFALYNRMLGPHWLFVAAFIVITAPAFYLSIRKIEEKRRSGEKICGLEVLIPGIILLDVVLYFVSGFISDMSGFSLYYVIDLAITLSLAGLLVALKKEEQHDIY